MTYGTMKIMINEVLGVVCLVFTIIGLCAILSCPIICFDIIMNLAMLIGSSSMSLLIFTILCAIGFIVGICMILYAVKETVFLVREVIQEKKE